MDVLELVLAFLVVEHLHLITLDDEIDVGIGNLL